MYRRTRHHRLTSIGAVVAVTATMMLGSPGAAAAKSHSNGGRSAVTSDDPPITVGDGWSATTDTPPAFFWSGGGQPFNNEGAFTYSSAVPTLVSVTDDFSCGDQFRIFDNGSPIGTTSAVSVNADCLEVGPDAAFASSADSNGSFLLPAGSHSITIQTIVNPFGDGGRGYIRVDLLTDPIICVHPPAPPAGATIARPGVPTIGTAGSDIIYGTNGDDRISSGGGNDVVFGLGGNDQIDGGTGDDVLCGGPGKDSLNGGPGNDILSGGDGSDVLIGGTGDDQLFGDAGNDSLSGGAGSDQLFGGPGTDRLQGDAGADTCTPGDDPGDASSACETIL